MDSWGPSYAACLALRLLGSPCVSFVQDGLFRGQLGAELSPKHLAALPHPGTARDVAWPMLVDLEISPAVWGIHQIFPESQPECLIWLWCGQAAGVQSLLLLIEADLSTND